MHKIWKTIKTIRNLSLDVEGYLMSRKSLKKRCSCCWEYPIDENPIYHL